MDKKNLNAPKNWRYFRNLKSLIIVNAIIALIITISFNSDTFGTLEFFNKWPEFTYSFLISFVLSYGISAITDLTDKHISWIHQPAKRFIVEVISVSVFAFIIGIIFSTISLTLIYDYSFDSLPWSILLKSTRYPIIISLIVTVAFTSRAFLFEWKTAAIASEKLRADKYEGQYQSLKNQLNPHFLFNSLNTLSNLVYEDQEKAVEFIQKLSKIYRYVLEVQKEELVTLGQELKFLESYLGLQKLRFGDNLIVNINIERHDLLIPPLSLQLLLENAIKHNIISKEKPLKIDIYNTKDGVIVSNNLQPKNIEEKSTGIGLDNIKSRLTYFTDKQLLVTKTSNQFIVELPLLEEI